MLIIEQIRQINQLNAADPAAEVYLFDEPVSALSETELLEKIKPEECRMDLYCNENGRKYTLADNARLKESLNLARISDVTVPRYAFVCQNCNLRLYPSVKGVYLNNQDIDYFAVKWLKIGDRLIVWHTDWLRKWCFVQTNNAWGWVEAENIAYTEMDIWLNYAKRDFVTSLLPKMTLQTEQKLSQEIYFATRLALADARKNSMEVLLPQKGAGGELVLEKIFLPNQGAWHRGYAPLTGENILRLGEKFIGERYAWGGVGGGHDCTSLIADLYASCGIIMPSNSYKQLHLAGIEKIAADMPLNARRSLIQQASTGSVLLFRGHGMIYCGERNERQLILHSVYRLKEGFINQTIVGFLEQKRENGHSLLESVEGIWDIWRLMKNQ